MINRIENEIETLKLQLINHPLYKMMKSQEDLQVFMEHHVYAVWDFMSLVKKLQVDLTTTTLPWVPPTMPSAGRLINEIVWGEETDINKDGVPMSHFEMYLESMEQVGASTSAMNHFLSTLSESSSIQQHIASAELPNYIKEFLKFTFEVIESNKTHIIAAVFTFGREDLIPDMFISMIKKMNRDNDQDFDQIIYYFERHIEVDGDSHGPMALQMIKNLCGTDPIKWEEAISASKSALERRIALWDGINLQITQKEKALS